MALFSNTTMKIANREQNDYQVIECPFCRQSNSFDPKERVLCCPNCGRDIWSSEIGYYGLLDLFPEADKWGIPL
ncbi:MAG: hypothetical protein ACOX4Q_07585 [Syntrophomonadales bacterium]|jgi:hypothetical protein